MVRIKAIGTILVAAGALALGMGMPVHADNPNADSGNDKGRTVNAIPAPTGDRGAVAAEYAANDALTMATGGISGVGDTARTPAVTPSAAAAPSDCLTGWVCFYTGRDYTGDKCQWDIADPHWGDLAPEGYACSWAYGADLKMAKSVYNNGTSHDGSTGVAFYWDHSYGWERIGCTKNQSGGNLSGDYVPLSHRWVSNKCGS